MPTFDEVMALAAPPQDTVSLCLAGDLLAELHDLQRRLPTAPALAASLAERSPAAAIEDQIADVRQRMQAATVTFRLQRIHPRAWTTFYAGRPMRDLVEESEDAWNDRWFDWLTDLVARTCIDPVMTAEQVATLVDQLNAESWSELSEAAWALNTGKVSVPFSVAVSATTQNSGPKSRRRPTSTSRTANGAAPHLSASPPTSTTTGN